MIVELRYQDIIEPSADGPNGLISWVLNPCVDCTNRQQSSSFLTQFSKVKFEDIKKGETPDSLVCFITLVY